MGVYSVYTTNICPNTLMDMNVGATNTAILRLGSNGVFLQNGSIYNVWSITTNSIVFTPAIDTAR